MINIITKVVKSGYKVTVEIIEGNVSVYQYKEFCIQFFFFNKFKEDIRTHAGTHLRENR